VVGYSRLLVQSLVPLMHSPSRWLLQFLRLLQLL
jgi:hypothetical protein